MPSYVVTGASRGIGLEFVRQLSASPDNIVFALVRSKATAFAVPLSPLKTPLANIHVLEADVTDHKALKVAAEKVAQLTGGSLDVLISNAAALNGDNDWRSLLDFEGEEDLLEEEFDRAFKVNVMGVIHVITIGAGNDLRLILKLGHAQMVAYGPSKAAANMIVAKFAVKLQTEGIISVSLSPGQVDTSATGRITQKNSEWIARFGEKLKESFTGYYGMINPQVSVKKQLEIIELHYTRHRKVPFNSGKLG